MPMRDRRTQPRAILTLFLALFAATSGIAGPPQQAGGASLDTLRWISGAWRMTKGNMNTEEHWTDVGGNMMLGVGRTLAGGKTVFFEFLRIEARADAIYYVAQPKGGPGTDFKLTRGSASEAVFENPAHDFPKRVIYRRNADGSITARIDGGEGVAKGAEEFHYLPLKK